jgi:hypothetical protein
MLKPNGIKKAVTVQKKDRTSSEVEEFNHERNPVAAAQKQMATQETAGVLEQE